MPAKVGDRLRWEGAAYTGVPHHGIATIVAMPLERADLLWENGHTSFTFTPNDPVYWTNLGPNPGFSAPSKAEAVTSKAPLPNSDLLFFQRSSHPDVCPKCAAPKPCCYHG